MHNLHLTHYRSCYTYRVFKHDTQVYSVIALAATSVLFFFSIAHADTGNLYPSNATFTTLYDNYSITSSSYSIIGELIPHSVTTTYLMFHVSIASTTNPNQPFTYCLWCEAGGKKSITDCNTKSLTNSFTNINNFSDEIIETQFTCSPSTSLYIGIEAKKPTLVSYKLPLFINYAYSEETTSGGMIQENLLQLIYVILIGSVFGIVAYLSYKVIRK